MQRKRIAAIFLLLLSGVGLLVYLGQRERRRGELFYSGTIEARRCCDLPAITCNGSKRRKEMLRPPVHR